MPYKAKSPQRPWTSKPTEYNKIIGQGRYFISGFYKSKQWRRARAAHLADNPVCEECKKEGKTVLGNIVDHIKPVNQKDPFDTHGSKFGEPLDFDNMQTLCKHHHEIKSANERWKK